MTVIVAVERTSELHELLRSETPPLAHQILVKDSSLLSTEILFIRGTKYRVSIAAKRRRRS